MSLELKSSGHLQLWPTHSRGIFSISLIERLTPSISCISSHLRVDTSVCKLLKLSSILLSIELSLSKMTFKGRGESVSTSLSISP